MKLRSVWTLARLTSVIVSAEPRPADTFAQPGVRLGRTNRTFIEARIGVNDIPACSLPEPGPVGPCNVEAYC